MYWKYLMYVLRHKWYVMVECFGRGLIWRGIMHDMSKFYPDEFIPYARYFYGKWADREQYEKAIRIIGYYPLHDTEWGVKKAFDAAWLKHQHRNPHHWQYWVLKNDTDGTYPIDMPRKYAIEMVCDWIGAGIAINGKRDVLDWYEKNKYEMNLNVFTRNYVEAMLG